MISIVIPVLNEAGVLEPLYARVRAAADRLGERYEVVVVDDGSTDGSLERLWDLHGRDPRWKVLAFSRNFGHQAAVSAGLHYARGDAVVVLDADLQDPPERIADLVERWRAGFQVVYAIRTKRKEGWVKRVAYHLFYRMLHQVAHIDIPLDAGDFCLMDRAVVDVLKAMPERGRFVRGLRSWTGFRQTGVPYEREARAAGEAKYTYARLARLAMDGLLSFSSLPLRLSSCLGLCLCGLSVVVGSLLAAWWWTDRAVAGMRPSHAVGWTSLCLLILFLSGLQFLVLGLLGEYVARMFDEVKGRPPWVIAQAAGIVSEDAGTPVGWFVPRSVGTPADEIATERRAA